MATRDDGTGKGSASGSGTSTLPVVPAIAQAANASSLPEDPTPSATQAPEALGFNLRFEAGRALLALENKVIAPGIEIKRALFEVPDVAFPLDVSGGAQRFQQKRLTLRAIEMSLTHAALFVPDKLKAAGFTLVRERSRAGAIELLVEVQGPSGPVPVRARGVIVPVGEAGAALVLHELISFGSLPRPRLELCASLLDALALPGALPARAMLKRSEPFRAVLSRLLPLYGWKVPALGDVRVHEVVLGKGDIMLRAWAREIPDGWKVPRDQKRGPVEEAVALAVFADGLVEAGDDAGRLALVDRLIDDKSLPASVVPFAADVLRADARRRAEADDLVTEAVKAHGEHTGLLAAYAEIENIAPLERGQRLAALGRAAEAGDEPWVAARAFLAASHAARDAGDLVNATKHAESAYLADPSLPETGALFSELLALTGDAARAVSVGRTALERAETPEQAEVFAVRLARLARTTEGADAARVLLRRALRRADRVDALVALVELEVEAGALERAAELLTRLLVLTDAQGAQAGSEDARADVEQLAAHIASARGDREAARMHLQKAQRLRPSDATIAIRLAQLLDDGRDAERPLEALGAALEDPACPAAPLLFAARLLLRRGTSNDAERARALLARVPAGERGADANRLDAEAEALLGRPAALAGILAEEAATLAPGEAAARRIEAGRLWLRAGDEARAADALVAAMPDTPAAVAEILERADGPTLADAVGERAEGVAVTALHGVAQRVAAAGRARDAHALLRTRADRASLEHRASFAEAMRDVPLEVAERIALLDSVSQDSVSQDSVSQDSVSRDDPKAAAWLRRLGALHTQPGGQGAGAAADAYARAAALGSPDVRQWLEAALASADGARLAAVLRRDDVEVAHVPSGPLRDAIAALDPSSDRGVRLRLAAALAARAERIDDVEAYLAEARALPPERAAVVLAQAAEQHGRAAWLIEAAELLANTADAAGALELLERTGGVVARDPAVREQAFALALKGDDSAALERAARRFLELEGLSLAVRASVHERRLKWLTAHEPARAPGAAAEWLDDEPGSEAALEVLVPSRIAEGETRSVVARLDDACRAGPVGPRVVVLLDDAAAAAHKQGNVEDEVRARELLLGAPLEPARRCAELETLADLYAEVNRPESAVDVLEARVALGGEPAVLAELFLRVAHLEEHQLKRPERAADALRGRLTHVPDDAGASRRLQALLEATSDDAGLFSECMRRADRLKPSAERNDLLLKAGEAALRRSDTAAATEVWLRALRSAPFSKDALQRLLDLGRAEKNRRLSVRARVAAARTLAEGKGADGAAAAEIAAEAGAYLAGVMNRPRLALLCFQFAERSDKKPARHTRVLVDLLRAVGDADGALAALDRLLDKAKERDRALLYESRADILEQLKHDVLAAADARRQALQLDATQKTSARSLARYLRAEGDVRGAIAVDRAYAAAALEGPALAAVLAQLAAEADEDLKDAALAAELCAQSLALAPSHDVLRRHARVLEALGRSLEAVDALAALLADELRESLSLDDQIALFRTKAHLEREQLGRREEARRTLRRALAAPALAQHADVDQLIDELSRAEEELDEPAAAASLLLDVLAEHPSGTRALGARATVLERAGSLLDDARDAERALALLNEAATLDALSRAGELRRARLAEEAGAHDVAEQSLARLLTLSPDAEQRVALLGRIASAAERAGHLETAMASWLERQERAPGDPETLRAIERLGLDLGRLDDARAAAESLARLEAGASDEQHARVLRLARDARDRMHDPAMALAWFARALALASSPALRRESLAAAEAASDTRAALALLVELEDDGLSAAERVRRAQLRLGADGAELDDASLIAVDLLRAVADGYDAAAMRALMDALWERAPAEAWHQLLALAPARDAGFDLLRASLPAHILDAERDPLATPLETLLAAADALPDDPAIVRAAARREREAGHTLKAADRLIALAEVLVGDAAAVDDARSTLEEAATAVLDGAGSSAVLARLDRIRPALARSAALRGKALIVLRDAEAWDPIAQVLEDAVALQSGAEQRATRLELVSVLRTGVGSEERAAPHLRSLVEQDADDREAWGELFECLDALGDKPALADALGRRSKRASGIEKRELVRRRASLLVEDGQGAAVLDELVSVRREHPADAELFELERRVHEQEGASFLAAFLYAELLRTPDATVARQLLALHPQDVETEARVRALLVLSETDAEPEALAAASLDARLVIARAVAESVAVTTRLRGDARDAFLDGLARAATQLGSRGALVLFDSLVDAGVVEAARAFGVATIARRWRVAGPARAAAKVSALRRAATSDSSRRQAALVEIRLAARRGRAEPLRAALASAEGVLRGEAAAALGAIADGSLAQQARATIEADAVRSLHRAAASASAVACAVRLGDAHAALPARSERTLRVVARRARHLRLTPERLPARLALALHLEDAQALDDLQHIAALARSLGRHADAVKALDRTLALVTRPDGALLRDRADAALDAGDADAEQWAERAADALCHETETPSVSRADDLVRLRRRAVELKLRRASEDLGEAIRLLARAAPVDAALQAEALGLAQAAGLLDLVDELMASAAEHSAGADARAEAIRRRASHRLHTLKDAAGAFRVLVSGAAAGDRALHEEAYALAAREGLVEELADVVDDALARAGLLALLGRRREAIDLAVHLETPAAWLLLAELAAREGDDESEAAALERLAQHGAADASARALLVRLDVRRGRVEEAAHGAADLLDAAGPSADRVLLLLDVAGGGAGASRTAAVLRGLVDKDAIPQPLYERALDVWEAAATVAGLADDVRAARLRRCRLRDDDTLWNELLVMELPRVGAEDAALWMRPLLGRDAIVRALIERGVQGLPGALTVLVQIGDAAVVGDALARAETALLLSWPLREVLGSALEAQGRAADAAAALARGAVEPDARAARARRAASLFLAAAMPDRAADVLLSVPLDDVDEELLAFARTVAPSAQASGALLAVRVALLTAEDADVDAALAAAESAPADVALAIAGWRMKAAPLDDRAWRLVALRGVGPAQELFATALALRGLGAWPAQLVDDAARLHRLRAGSLPAHVATSWVEASRRRTLLQRARAPRAALRKAAWSELATQSAHDDVKAARFLARAGVPIGEAPIEVRLAADPALNVPAARVLALTEALASEPYAQPSARRSALLARFTELDERGFVGAAARQDLLGARAGLAPQIDGADLGAGVDAARVLAALGRRPNGAARATAAALLALHGSTELAVAVDARTVARSTRGPSSEKLEERADRAAQSDRHEEAVSLLLLVTGLRGFDAKREERMRELAGHVARFDVVAASLGRSAFGTDDLTLRARLLLERAELRLKKLDDARGAARDAAHAATLTEEPDACRAWLAAAEALGDTAEVSRALDALGSRNLDPTERRELAVTRAQLLLETLGDAKGAVAHIDGALAQGLRTPRLLELHGEAFERLDRVAEAAGAYASAAEDAADAERARLRRRAAATYEGGGLFDLAVDALCRGDADDTLRAEAEALARDKAGPAALAQVLDVQLAATEDPHRRRLLSLERARLLADKLGDRSGAIALLEKQATADASDFGARLALASWYADERRLLDAALAYESAARIPAIPPEVAGGAAREAAALLGGLGDLPRAGPLADQAIEAGAVDLKVLAVAEAWHRAEGRFDRVDELLDREIALEADARKQAHLYMERFALRRDWLSDPAGARKVLVRALELDPLHEGALEVLRADAQRDGSFGALRAALFRAADVAVESAVRARLLKELAALDLERFNDFKAAEATIDRALQAAPADGDALVFKARLLARAGQVDGLGALLERAERAGVTSLPGSLNIVRGDGLVISGDREAARHAFFEATKDKETATKAWDRLIDLADGTPQVALVLEEARGATDDPKRVQALLRKEARVRIKGGDDEGALRIHEELLKAEPGDADALKWVREAYTKKRKLAPLVPLLQGFARAAEGSERAHRLADFGAFLLDEIGNEAQARAAFEEALTVDAAEPRALLGLADIAWAARDDERALDLLDRITPAQWPREQTELLYRRARCAYALGRDDAQDRLRAVLRADAKHQDALQMLVQLSLLKQDDDAAEFALESLANAIPAREDPVRLAQVFVDLANLRGRQGKHAEALVAAERAFDLDPTKLEILETVALAREAAGKFGDAAEAWRRIAALRTGAPRIDALEHRVASLQAASRVGDAIDELLELRRETGLTRFKEQAEAIARQSQDPALLKRAGIAPPPAPAPAPIAAPPTAAVPVPTDDPPTLPEVAPVSLPRPPSQVRPAMSQEGLPRTKSQTVPPTPSPTPSQEGLPRTKSQTVPPTPSPTPSQEGLPRTKSQTIPPAASPTPSQEGLPRTKSRTVPPAAPMVSTPAPVPAPVAASAPAMVSGLGPAVADRTARLPAAPAEPEAAAEVTSTQTSANTSQSASGSNRAIQRGFNALHMQVRANIEENDARTALRIITEAFAAGQGDDELMRLAEEAAERGNAWAAFMELLDARLKSAPSADDAKAIARRGARVAKDKLADLDRAAALLYQAHQADAEDVDVRFELTEIYAQIPRLAAHAVTGVLQLLRRIPSDERVFRLAADLAESQQQLERARALRRIEDVLGGRGIPTDVTKRGMLDERPPVRPLDAEAIASRMAPTGWGGPLQQLLTLCGSAIELALYGDGVVPPDAKPLHEATPRGALALDRMERLLPGRPFRAFAAKVDRVTMVPSAVPTVLLPVDLLGLGDASLLAAVARAYGLVRMSHPIIEILKPGDEGVLLEMLRTAFIGTGGTPRADKLIARLSEAERLAARGLAQQVFAQPVDIGATLGVLSRGADRLALVASGDVLATLHVSSLPTLLREPPQRARTLLGQSPRALELCGFAARDNAWLVRRQQGLSS